jgi:hypothetical protein
MVAQKPNCFGTYEDVPDCQECTLVKICRATTAKSKRRSERKEVLTEKVKKIVELPQVLTQFAIEVAAFVVEAPRRARAIRAYCWTCDQVRGCCGAPACPLYFWRRHKNFPALCWWMEPRDKWEDGYNAAMELESKMVRAFDADAKEKGKEDATEQGTEGQDPPEGRGKARGRRRQG